jgi:hypothetical protein
MPALSYFRLKSETVAIEFEGGGKGAGHFYPVIEA